MKYSSRAPRTLGVLYRAFFISEEIDKRNRGGWYRFSPINRFLGIKCCYYIEQYIHSNIILFISGMMVRKETCVKWCIPFYRQIADYSLRQHRGFHKKKGERKRHNWHFCHCCHWRSFSQVEDQNYCHGQPQDRRCQIPGNIILNLYVESWMVSMIEFLPCILLVGRLELGTDLSRESRYFFSEIQLNFLSIS